MNGLGFIPPRRWPSRLEFSDNKKRMASVRQLADTLSPVKLGEPDILYQGDVGSCGGEAIVQDIHIDKQADGQESEILSPSFPYWCARRRAVARDEDVADVGIDPFDMTQAIDDFGACKFLNMQRDTSRPNEKPGALAFQTAQRVRARMSPILESGDDLWAACKYVLTVERDPLFLGIEVRPAFDDPGMDGYVDSIGGESRGGHAVCAYGWDERGVIIANSWGTSWGNLGRGVLSPRYLAECCMFAASVKVKQ